MKKCIIMFVFLSVILVLATLTDTTEVMILEHNVVGYEDTKNLLTTEEQGVKDGFNEIETFVKKYAADTLDSTKIFGTRDFLTESTQKNYTMDDF